ncbi:MAG TPA: TadE/TadG family type IV pilus assembly protein [Mycobacteriales bacterium]|nr:TadE/TadG family type IV pilus assembly protein [Mycobacteriales bacterium]
MTTRAAYRDAGSAVAEFVLVVGFLLIPLFLGILQLGMVLHARNVVVASAAAGARYGANVDRRVEDGAAEACRRIREALARVEERLRCTGAVATRGGADPVDVVEVRVDGPLPMFFLPLGSVDVDVTGHAVREVAP